MNPILQIRIELTPEQVKQMEGATKVLERMSDKGKPGAFLAQIECTGNDFGGVNRAFGTTPHMKCYVIPSYLMKRLIRIVARASNPANKIPRRNYWKAAATGILKYIKNCEVERRPRPHINYENSKKPFGGRYAEQEIDDDIPF